MTIQLDWIEQSAPAYSSADLAAIDESLQSFPDYVVGKAADVRRSLLEHRAALLGQCGAGASIPPDVRFKETYAPFKLDIAGRPAQFHAWVISDSHMEMAGGTGVSGEQARARAMVGLMLGINESIGARVE